MHRGLLVAHVQPAEVPEPTDGAYDGRAALVSEQRAAVLRALLRLAIAVVRRGHLDALIIKVFVELVALVRLVADNAPRRVAA